MKSVSLPLLLAATLLATPGPAAAASIWLSYRVDSETLCPDPAGATVVEGSTFTVDLCLDARDAPGTQPGLYGGEIIIDFDPALLGYGGFDPAGLVSFFKDPVTGTADGRQTVSFGFDNGPSLGLVGSFTFTALGEPETVALIGIADTDDFFGTFVSYVPTYQPFYPSFTPLAVGITPVPLPTTAWLLVSGLGLLGAWRRTVRGTRRAG